MKFLMQLFSVVTLAMLISSLCYAESLQWCTDQSHCTSIAEGADARSALELLQSNQSCNCKGECRIEYNDCLAGGSSRTECAALRAGCETHCP